MSPRREVVMDVSARHLLTTAIARHGAERLVLDSRPCEGLLRDVFRDRYPRELSVILAAVRDQVAAELSASSVAPTALQRRLGRLTQRLQDRHGLEALAARWAVESWAVALGRTTSAQLDRERSGAAERETSPAAASAGTARRSRMAGFVLATCLMALALDFVVMLPVVPQATVQRASESAVVTGIVDAEVDSWRPGIPHPHLEHVVSSARENRWMCEPGYKWLLPEDPTNLECVAANTGFVGLLLAMDLRSHRPVIASVSKGGSAERAGLVEHEHIVTVNGVSTSNKSLRDVVAMIRGPVGTRVQLVVDSPRRHSRTLELSRR